MINKKELVSAYSKKSGVTLKEADLVVTQMCEVLTEAIIEKDGFRLTDLFSIAPKKHAGRDYRNPRTGEKAHVDDYITLKITVSSKLMAKLNNK